MAEQEQKKCTNRWIVGEQLMQAPEMEPEPWPVVKAVLATQAPEKGQEGGATLGEARSGTDPLGGQDPPA